MQVKEVVRVAMSRAASTLSRGLRCVDNAILREIATELRIEVDGCKERLYPGNRQSPMETGP